MSKPMLRWGIALVVLALIGGLVWAFGARQPQAGVRSSLVGLPQVEDANLYERAEGPQTLVFPRDHGPHPDFQTEWWYYTGNLAGENGQRFGFQLTFFRRAALPPAERVERESEWATEQIYMAHFTVTDVDGRAFYNFERFERGAAGLAGATGEPAYSVWLRNWSVEQTGEDTYRLRAAAGEVALDLSLLDRKGPVFQGEQGYSRKGPQSGNASLYYSQTRLETQGQLTVQGRSYPVSGLSWLDREISTSALSKGQVGWDWFALQFDDGSELMAYVIRRADGTVDAFSNGTFIAPDGSTRSLAREDFEITPDGSWQSARSGGKYPARWTVRVPAVELELAVEPLLADQELSVSVVYWEGAVKVQGERAGRPLAGYGYVELTGYADSLEGEL